MRTKCRINGCERYIANKKTGLCHLHNLRLIRTGTTDERPKVDKSKKCSVDGCDKQCATHIGLCLMHYKRFARHGTTDLIPFQHKYEKICSVCGKAINGRNGSAKGLCAKHYRSLKVYGDPSEIDKRNEERKNHIGVRGYLPTQGGVPAHRKIYEDYIGRKLQRYECIHHINLDKTDNRIENLHLFKSQNEHQKAHVELSVVAAEFIKRGIIKFEDGHYRINI